MKEFISKLDESMDSDDEYKKYDNTDDEDTEVDHSFMSDYLKWQDLSPLEWCLWVGVLLILGHLLFFYFRVGGYDSCFNEYEYNIWRIAEWEPFYMKMMLYYFLVPLVLVIFWHVYIKNWSAWGTFIVVGFSLWTVIFYGDFKNGWFRILVTVICLGITMAALYFLCSDKFDKFMKHFRYEEDEEVPDYDELMMRLSNYYIKGINKFDLFETQVTSLLNNETGLLDTDFDDERYSYILKDYNITPERLEAVNWKVTKEFCEKYHESDKTYDSSKKRFERFYRKVIAGSDNPEYLVTYAMIALYKNSREYNSFSILFAREYFANYIRNGIVEKDELFASLNAQLLLYDIIDDEGYDKAERVFGFDEDEISDEFEFLDDEDDDEILDEDDEILDDDEFPDDDEE